MLDLTPDQIKKGLNAANRILDKWGCDDEVKSRIIGEGDNQLNNISYILNIHAALRTLFNNPDNYYGWVNMNNDNGRFNGRKPICLMLGGDIGYVHQHITSKLY